jgi:hypothetical protein
MLVKWEKCICLSVTQHVHQTFLKTLIVTQLVKNPSLLHNYIIYYSNHKILSLQHVPSQINTVRIFTTYFYQINPL